jgi:hypothetical protein
MMRRSASGSKPELTVLAGMANLLLILSLLVSPSIAQNTGQKSTIDYATVEQAFNALEANPDAEITEYEGWIIFNQKGDGRYILWSFTPEQHPAHPTAIRREIAKQGDEVLINMNALCESGKFECDQLIDQFKRINEKIKRNMLENS